MEFGYLPLILFQIEGKNVNILKFYFPLTLFQAGIEEKREYSQSLHPISTIPGKNMNMVHLQMSFLRQIMVP